MAKQEWTDERREAFTKALKSRKSRKEIATEFGVRPTGVSTIASFLGIGCKRKASDTTHQAMRMIARGASVAEIVEATGLHFQTVYAYKRAFAALKEVVNAPIGEEP